MKSRDIVLQKGFDEVNILNRELEVKDILLVIFNFFDFRQVEESSGSDFAIRVFKRVLNDWLDLRDKVVLVQSEFAQGCEGSSSDVRVFKGDSVVDQSDEFGRVLDVTSLSGEEVHDLDVKDLVLAVLDELSQSEKSNVLRLGNFLDDGFETRNAGTLEFVVTFVFEAVREEVDDVFVF